jgi:RNA polymerase sigma-70 factor (ECF subfamily)
MAGSLELKDVSAILAAWGNGDQRAGNELVEIVYQELRRLAAHYLKSERGDHTLQPTALVHELYLKLFATERCNWIIANTSWQWQPGSFDISL